MMTIRQYFHHTANVFRYIRFFVNEFFRVFLVLFLLLFLLEQYVPGFVSYSINFTWLLGAVVVLGGLSALFPEKTTTRHAHDTSIRQRYGLTILLALIGGILIFLKIHSLGNKTAGMVALLAAVMIALLSLVLNKETDDPEQQ